MIDVGNANGKLKQQVSHYADEAIAGVRAASDYVRNNDLGAMRADVESQVRAHPVATLAIGLAAGFMLGKLVNAVFK